MKRITNTKTRTKSTKTTRKSRSSSAKAPRKVSRDGYLLKKYAISELEFLAQLRSQGNVCKICGCPPPQGRNFHVDHDHSVERTKIICTKQNGLWVAGPAKSGGIFDFTFTERTKQEARAKVKRRLLRLSIRGIICYRDNVALQKFSDDALRMQAAAEYIQAYERYRDGVKPTHFGE